MSTFAYAPGCRALPAVKSVGRDSKDVVQFAIASAWCGQSLAFSVGVNGFDLAADVGTDSVMKQFLSSDNAVRSVRAAADRRRASHRPVL